MKTLPLVYFELTSAVSTASILAASGLSGADHGGSDVAIGVRSTAFIREDRHVDLVEDVGHWPTLAGGAPSHRGGEFADKVLCRIGVGETDREDLVGEGDGIDPDEGHIVVKGP